MPPASPERSSGAAAMVALLFGAICIQKFLPHHSTKLFPMVSERFLSAHAVGIDLGNIGDGNCHEWNPQEAVSITQE
jgi:hypothetical protein